MDEKEKELLKRADTLKEENKKYEAELEALSKEATDLEKEELQYWERIAAFESSLVETEEDSGKVKSSLSFISQEYQRLSSINVINDSFKITCPERVAAINGFRLGRLPSEDVFERNDTCGALGEMGRDKRRVGAGRRPPFRSLGQVQLRRRHLRGQASRLLLQD